MTALSDFILTPLLSQIEGNLWLGACPEDVPFAFRCVVSLCNKTPRTHSHQLVTKQPLRDEALIPDIGLLYLLATHVNRCKDLGPTLVHCRAGLNRSGLVVALALMERGMPVQRAIALLREKRSPQVLFNQTFEAWLLKHG